MPSGYRGRVLRLLERYGANVGDRIQISSPRPCAGVVMPRYHHYDDSHIVLKLDSGYNVGVSVLDIEWISVLERPPPESPPPPSPEVRKGLPDVLLVSTGGTIASHVDYRTGAVTPALDAAQLGDSMPEMYRMANVYPLNLISEYSENITPEHWVQMARTIHRERDNYDGIIVAHGTDTMHYTAAYLSFALAGCGTPIILTGSQRSPDRASSDAAMNLAGAVSAIASKIPRGVYVAMHHTRSDDIVALHYGTRVRKNHASRRDAFHAIFGEPACLVRDGEVELATRGDYWGGVEYRPVLSVNRGAALVKYHPGYDVRMLERLSAGCGAVILEGTGLGHVGREAYGAIKSMVRRGTFVGMTSQCIGGRVRMTVYESGRDLLEMGVVPLYMIPETALVKAMWAMSHSKNLRHTMTAPTASEVM